MSPRETAEQPRPSGEERVSRNATFALLAQMVGAALTALLTVFLGRALSASQYGVFTFALSVITIATMLADLGVTSSAGRFLAGRRDEPLEAAAVFRTAVRLKLQIGVPAGLAMLLLAGPIGDLFNTEQAVWALRASALAMFAQSFFLLFLGAFISLGKIRYNLLLATIESVVETVASIALVLAGAQATGAVYGRATGYLVGLGASLWVANRVIGPLRSRDRGFDHAVVTPREIVSYAGPLLAVDAAFRVFSSIDVLLIAALVGGSAKVAAFGLAMRLAYFLDYPAGALTSAVAPRLAGSGSDGRGRELLTKSMRYLTILQMLFTVPLVIWPEAIMHLIFAAKYPGAPAVLRALAPYVFISGLAQLTTLSVNYLGHAKRRIPIAAAMLSVNLIIDVVLLPRIGIVAGAIGTSAAYALWVPAHILILRHYAGLKLRPLLVTTARSCVAGAAMVGALALIGTGIVPFPAMALGAIVGPVVYLLALFALRELTGDDVGVMRRALARRVAA